MEHNLKLIAENNGFRVYFNTTKQEYSVFKNGKLIIDKKIKFSEVKSYID
jgi:hypothetical protein